MSDNRGRYRAIRKSLKNLCPFEPKGNQARHLNTLLTSLAHHTLVLAMDGSEIGRGRLTLSLFQLGLDLLECFLDEHLPILVAFQMPTLTKSVR